MSCAVEEVAQVRDVVERLEIGDNLRRRRWMEREALGSAADPHAVLMRFVTSVSDILRRTPCRKRIRRR